MQMDIHLFTYIRNSDYAISVSFSLSQIEYTYSERYIKNNASAVVRFYLHTPKEQSVILEHRNLVFNFNRFGYRINASRKIITESDKYARIVDNNPEFQKAESDLIEAVCQIIGLAVKKHFADEAAEN